MSDHRDAAIEKAAEAIWNNSNPPRLDDWENTRRATREAFLPVARAAYDAIAPILIAPFIELSDQWHHASVHEGKTLITVTGAHHELWEVINAIVRGDTQ